MQLIFQPLGTHESVTVQNASDQEIATRLPGARSASIAEGSESWSYMQFGTSRRRGIELEYQIDSLENHFKAVDPTLTMDRVISAFQKFAEGDESWKSDFQWERMDVITVRGQKTLVIREWLRQLGDADAAP